MAILLGSVADDFTGATDLANTLVKAGMRTIQLLGVPRPGLEVPPADAIIVALKSRSNPPARPWKCRLLRWRGCAPTARGSSTSSTAPPSTPLMPATSGRWRTRCARH